MSDKVIAIRSSTESTVYSYGEGVLLGNLVPNQEPFLSAGVKNPCIKLDSGKYVWGFQCWWGPKDKMLDKFKNQTFETVEVEDEILPVQEVEEPANELIEDAEVEVEE